MNTPKKGKGLPGSDDVPVGTPPAGPEAAMPTRTSALPACEWHSRGYLPHRDRIGLLQSITFRLADSLPKAKVEQLENDMKGLPDEVRMIEERKRIEFWLDSGLGCCALKHREVGSYVQDSLLFGDPRRYRLIAWCVMPNHVHVLIDPLSSVSRIVQGWKSYTGRWALKQNERLELSIPDPDHFWMRDYWDRYIRNEEHLNNVIDYIHRNPVKAKLCRNPEDWAWSSAGMPLGAPTSPSAPQLQGPNK